MFQIKKSLQRITGCNPQMSEHTGWCARSEMPSFSVSCCGQQQWGTRAEIIFPSHSPELVSNYRIIMKSYNNVGLSVPKSCLWHRTPTLFQLPTTIWPRSIRPSLSHAAKTDCVKNFTLYGQRTKWHWQWQISSMFILAVIYRRQWQWVMDNSLRSVHNRMVKKKGEKGLGEIYDWYYRKRQDYTNNE